MEFSTKAHIVDSFPSPTVDEIKDFETRNRIVLPDQYVKFLLSSNGGRCNGGDAIVGGLGGFVFALRLMYALNAPYEYWNLQSSLNDKNIMYPKYRKFLPIGIDPYGNEFCMRASNRKKSDVWLLDHETAEFDSRQARSFDEFLGNLYQNPGRFRETSPICQMIEAGRYEEFKSCLLANNVNFDEVGKDGCSLLSIAAWNKHPEICRLLIGAGFDVNKRDADGATALYLTTSVDVIRILIESGADVEARANNGETPFARHIKYGYERSAIALLKFGARVDSADPEKLKLCKYVIKYLESL